MEQFYNRERELDFLSERFHSQGSGFIILYGRRRVGKTALLKEFLEGKNGIYHLVSRESEKDQLEEFKQTISAEWSEVEELKNDWEVILKNVGKKLDVLAVDEFQYLIETNKEILKIFQKAWDQFLKDSDIMLILTGSSIGMMENEVLGYKSPLYGRRTGQWHLKPFEFWELKKFFPSYSKTDLIKTYAVLGGTPYYLEQFNDDLTLEDNIKENILKTGRVLKEEAQSLLQEELREPKNYFSILKAVARGKTKFNEIRNETGIPKNSLSKYLQSLRNLHIIERTLPVTASEKSKRGRYYIKDNYFSFWFRYIFPNRTMLEKNWESVFENKIKSELDEYTSRKFEYICRAHVRREGRYNKVGRWWYKDNEIDIVALDEKEDEILFGECKWSKNETDNTVLRNLEETSEKVRWREKDRTEKFVLYSKSGFTKNIEEMAKERDDLELYPLQKI